jgi:hypothetical protein
MLGKMGMPSPGQERVRQKTVPKTRHTTTPTKQQPHTQTIEERNMDALTDEQLEKIFNEGEKPVKSARGKKHKK